MSRYFVATLAFILGIVAYSPAQEQAYDLQDSLSLDYDLFEVEEPAEVILKFDLKQFQRNKMKPAYLPAELEYVLNDSVSIKHEGVRLKARGNSRRELCYIPPIMINLKMADIQNENLKGYNKVKLVTNCNVLKKYDTYVFKEYLAYKIYQLISPNSFRVRLVKITYVDTGRKDKKTEAWSFLIEPEKMLADRLDMLAIKRDDISMRHTDTASMNLMSIFQYMIGNSDYSIAGRHNVKLMKSKDPFRQYLIPIPYDFDYSGIVNADYAVPGENLNISSVTERYFLGLCQSEEQYRKAIDAVHAQKDNIYALVNNFEYLPKAERESIIWYLDQFFRGSIEEGFVESSLRRTCR